MQRRGIQTMIYEGLGLPRVEFAAADVRDNDYDARTYPPTLLSPIPATYLLTYLFSGAPYSLLRVPTTVLLSSSLSPSRPSSISRFPSFALPLHLRQRRSALALAYRRDK